MPKPPNDSSGSGEPKRTKHQAYYTLLRQGIPAVNRSRSTNDVLDATTSGDSQGRSKTINDGSRRMERSSSERQDVNERIIPLPVRLKSLATSRDGEQAQPRPTSNHPRSRPVILKESRSLLENTTMTAGRDIIYNVGGNVTTNKEKPVLQKLKKLLKPVNAAHDSYDAEHRAKCFKNTRVQLLADIEKWITNNGNQAPIFVLDGVAGIGKSTVAQTIAERAALLDILVVSFFFTRNEEERTTGKHFFPTIAFQLARALEPFAHELVKALEEDTEAPRKTLGEQLNLLILNPSQDLSISKHQVLIVIDAIDECTERDGRTLLTLLAQHVHQLPWLKIFIAARPEYHIRGVLDKDPNHELFRLHEIEDAIVHTDIELYLKSSLSLSEVQAVFPHRNPPWQPTQLEMNMLCGICGTLFIIASTAVKFILDPKRANPGQRLTRLLEGVSPETHSGSKHTDVMDKVYVQIILSSAPEDLDVYSDDWVDRYQTIVGAIITLHTPLPCKGFAGLLGLSPADITETLAHLHSLVAPSGHNLVFRVHHKSFPDFITSKERIRLALLTYNKEYLTPHFFIDAQVSHSQIARGCLHVMAMNLKQNIANLPVRDWYADKSDIPKLSEWHPSDELAYAVQHWASHLQDSGLLNQEIIHELFEWSSNHIWSWLEVLDALNLIGQAKSILETAIGAIDSHIPQPQWPEVSTVKELLHDTAQHVVQKTHFSDISSMHLYWSGLAFVPARSQLHAVNNKNNTVQVLFGLEARQNPALAVLCTDKQAVKEKGNVILDPVPFSFSPLNGSRIATGSIDKKFQLWDSMTGQCIATHDGCSEQVTEILFSPTGLRLAWRDKGKVHLWDGTTGSHVATLDHGFPSHPPSIKFSSDESRLAIYSRKLAQLWDAVTGACVATLPVGSNDLYSIKFSSSGSRLASLSNKKKVELWDGMTGAHLATLADHSKLIQSFRISPDGSRVALITKTTTHETICLWDGTHNAPATVLARHPVSQLPINLTFSPNGQRTVTVYNNKLNWFEVQLWDGITGAPITALTRAKNTRHVEFSPDGGRIVGFQRRHPPEGSEPEGPEPENIILWNGITGAFVASLDHGSGTVASNLPVVFSQNGQRIATICKDKGAFLWDGITGEFITILKHHASFDMVKFSPDGLRIASTSNKAIYVWDGKTGCYMTTLHGHSAPVRTIKFSPNGLRLVSSSKDGIVRLWDPWSLPEESEQAAAVTISPTGSKLALVFPNKTIKIKHSQTDVLISTLKGHSSSIKAIAFSSDDSRLASASYNQAIHLWDTATGALLLTFTGHKDSVNHMTFSSDDSKLASASSDGTIKLWDTMTGAQLTSLHCQTGKVGIVTLHPDGLSLASVYYNEKRIQLWDLSMNKSIAVLKSQQRNTLKQLIFSPDGSQLVSLDGNPLLQIWGPGYKSIKVAFEQFKSILGFGFMPSNSNSNASGSPPDPSLPLAKPISAIMVVQRKDPSVFGLVGVQIQHQCTCQVAPFCWFPSGFVVTSCSFSQNCSMVAVLCSDNHVLVLDISNVTRPF